MISRIEIEGVDKTGKSTLFQYLDTMSNYRYVTHARGLLSYMVYADVYGRDYNYEKEVMDNTNTLVVLLTADIDDLKLRHKITHEPKIDIERDVEAFEKHAKFLEENGVTVRRYDTSIWTPYNIAKDILAFLEGEV